MVQRPGRPEAGTPGERTYGADAFTPSALRRSHFAEDGKPRPWERPERAERGRAPAPYGGGPVDRRGPAPAPQRPDRPNDVVRAAKKIGGTVMMLIALFCVMMTAAGVGQTIESIGAGATGDVALDVGMTAVFALISIWLAIKGLRWMQG